MVDTAATSAQLAGAADAPATRRSLRATGPWRNAGRHLLRSRNGQVGGAIVLLFLVMAVFGQALAPRDPLTQDLYRISEPPSADYWLGTDEIGRDFLSRILEGARTAMLIATLVTFIAAGTGALFGLVSAYLGGWVDGVLMRVADVVMSVPTLLFAAFVTATLRATVERFLARVASSSGIESLANRTAVDFFAVVFALSVVTWPGYARLIRSQVLSIKEREYIDAARSLGASTEAILRRHVLPNSIAPIVVAVSVNFGNALLSESALSYLGIGIQPPTPSWGQMINANLDQWLLPAPDPCSQRCACPPDPRVQRLR